MTAFTNEFRSLLTVVFLSALAVVSFSSKHRWHCFIPRWFGVVCRKMFHVILGEFSWSMAVQYAFESAVAGLFLDS